MLVAECDHSRVCDSMLSDGSVKWWLEFSKDMNFDQYFQFLPTVPPPTYDIMTWNSSLSIERSVSCYETGLGLGVSFDIDGREIKASKYLLILASPVFETMFSREWKESRENKIEIKDYDYDTVETFVKIIHGYEIKMTSFTKAVNLLMMSKMYEVDNLTDKVATYLDFGINKDTALDALAVGHRLDLVKMKTLAIEFIQSGTYGSANELAGIDELAPDIAIIVIKLLRP